MKSASALNAMPPFYKGLSLGEMGLLMLALTLVISLLGLVVYALFDVSLVLITAPILGIMSAFTIPKSVMRKLSRLKTHHCAHYVSKQIHRWYHSQQYHNETRRFACRRHSLTQEGHR